MGLRSTGEDHMDIGEIERIWEVEPVEIPIEPEREPVPEEPVEEPVE